MLKSKSIRNSYMHMKSFVFVWFVWVLALHSWHACTLSCLLFYHHVLVKADNNSDDNGNGGVNVCVKTRWKSTRCPVHTYTHTHNNPLSNLMWFIWMHLFPLIAFFIIRSFVFLFWSKTIAPNFCYANEWNAIIYNRYELAGDSVWLHIVIHALDKAKHCCCKPMLLDQ